MSKVSSSRSSSLERTEGISASYEALSFPFAVRSPSAKIAAAVDLIYRQMRAGQGAPSAYPIEIRARRMEGVPGVLELLFDGRKVFESERLGDILHQLDNELTILLEKAFPKLYFVHAAAVADARGAILLVGSSGRGKSTTCYALLSSGMTYLSDELSPIDPRAGVVHAYPRALCLKEDPPAPLELPRTVLRTEWTLHVKPRSLTKSIASKPLPLARVAFVNYSKNHSKASLLPISRGRAALMLYQNALNTLAHPHAGLDDTLRVVERAECFELRAAGIAETLRVLGREISK